MYFYKQLRKYCLDKRDKPQDKTSIQNVDLMFK